MKNILIALAFLTCGFVYSQVLDPVKWTTSVEKVSDTEYNLIATAHIDAGWHLYSQVVPEGGPIATTFIYDNSEENFILNGNTVEGEGHTVHDPIFEMEIKYFDGEAKFIQNVKVTKATSTINGFVEFMVCDDTRCLPPTEIDLEFQLDVKTALATETTEAVTPAVAVDNTIKTTEDLASNKGLWSIFFIAFLSGFAALLTPCVFPMIPMTVSFFTKQSKNKAAGIKNAIIYGICIIVIYLLLGIAVTGIFGADALNALATNVWFNIIFFVLLVVFAVSFLGAFEIMLPNSWANKVDSQADRGGLVGIFFMALALAIVSFSCTGPIVGTLLVEAASKGGVAPIIGMFGFSLAIALPFALFAAFPGWLNSLPKSGGWLNTVKVVLGFLELALAFKFLSQADLVLQLHILEREVFIAIWIAIFGTLAFYLFGKIKLPHDSPLTHISVGRLSLGLIVLTFTIYMIPGLWGAPLNIISAFPPPQDYSESPYGVGFSKLGSGGSASAHGDLPEGAHLLAPHDIMAFNDYDTGLAYAKKVGKPVMLDFTGWACVNCRKMEQNVWPEPEILNLLKNDVVLISLYVDDKRKLEADEIVDSQLKPGKKLKYIGQKWSEMQTIKYKSNSQPFYVIIDHNEEKLVEPVGYIPDVEAYHTWLKTGVSNF
ncbi:cytochrome c-type biogenesis protein DsbD, protein-disulfide reductase [Formosa agariphila KMM 3901]|uniref:Cytochrome c-type biogenesis protein DsbD, protein-disulfide reductase n=1 Tax=Formosa agariphila (strain DSM 15362 / KCTC 12365 / LMG 23005 / KMM 3901 / M-2Alg 35-1) TaxID=1347342 RepID=T2KM69_FORAG|nr:thioredoxin family protein [Formosa agariphila]CDF79558.1 cytochrome c-type biogenesis protein DsbD, protein-disulfide reductase [Formosa agariphila KMM 3901]